MHITKVRCESYISKFKVKRSFEEKMKKTRRGEWHRGRDVNFFPIDKSQRKERMELSLPKKDNISVKGPSNDRRYFKKFLSLVRFVLTLTDVLFSFHSEVRSKMEMFYVISKFYETIFYFVVDVFRPISYLRLGYVASAWKSHQTGIGRLINRHATLLEGTVAARWLWLGNNQRDE
ncbi:hypothetical protein V1477_017338 [Vespula maculifrons]|uniref:Uncharacterized protein n=1 Tax=Vespula maculifrons TaxID=7453 RepID=A0ABD2B5R0_VESMC